MYCKAYIVRRHKNNIILRHFAVLFYLDDDDICKDSNSSAFRQSLTCNCIFEFGVIVIIIIIVDHGLPAFSNHTKCQYGCFFVNPMKYNKNLPKLVGNLDNKSPTIIITVKTLWWDFDWWEYAGEPSSSSSHRHHDLPQFRNCKLAVASQSVGSRLLLLSCIIAADYRGS